MGVKLIGIAELGVVGPGDKISTLGLGSCVGVTMYDKTAKIAGMVHVMLPDSTSATGPINRAKFADTGVEDLLKAMLAKGAKKTSIVAKMAGGAHMFGNMDGKNEMLKIGARNAIYCDAAIRKLGLPLVAKDTGGSLGRTIELEADTGNLKIKTVGKSEKFI